jgi:phosphoheptose isomerase
MALKDSSLQILDDLLSRFPNLCEQREPIHHAVELLCDCHRAGKTILLCGNGGSAADCEHIAGELMKGFCLRRPLPEVDKKKLEQTGIADWQDLANNLQQGIRAISLTGHTALATAILNDNDPYMIFAQQVYVYGSAGDVLLALSTSGNAKNVVQALKVARALGLKTIGLTGSQPAAMDQFCDVMIKAPAEQTFQVQELHLPIYHAMCLMVEEELFGDKA